MNCRRKLIIARSRQINRDLGIEILNTRRGKRKDRDIDASFVHGIEALGSKIQQSPPPRITSAVAECSSRATIFIVLLFLRCRI